MNHLRSPSISESFCPTNHMRVPPLKWFVAQATLESLNPTIVHLIASPMLWAINMWQRAINAYGRAERIIKPWGDYFSFVNTCATTYIAQLIMKDPREESVLVQLSESHHWVVDKDCNTIHFTKEKIRNRPKTWGKYHEEVLKNSPTNTIGFGPFLWFQSLGRWEVERHNKLKPFKSSRKHNQ